MHGERERRPWIAGTLSVLTLGLGHLYNGQPKRAGIFYRIGVLIYIILLGTGLFLSTFWGMVIGLGIGLGTIALVYSDASNHAKRRGKIELKFYNRWYVYLIIFFVHALVVFPLVQTTKSFQTYKVPTASMEPTLLIGDHFACNLKLYADKQPERTDVVVCVYPELPEKLFIGRVIGLPGETIKIKERLVYVDDQFLKEPYLPSGYTAEVPTDKAREDFGPVKIPAGKLFILGDNRDQSADSRQRGFVDISGLRGKALYIYFSKKMSRIGMDIH